MNLLHAVVLAIAAAALAPAARAEAPAVDRSVDPCVDFHAFANNKWLRASSIPPDRSRWGTFDAVDRRTEEILTRAIDKALAAPATPGSARRKVLDFFASGMDEAGIARAGLAPLVPQLARIAAIDAPEALARAIAELHADDIDAPFSFDVQPDPKQSTRYLALLTQDGLGLPDRDYYFLDDERSREIRAAYRRHVARVLELHGDPAAAASADGVLALETELARASMTAVERRDVDRTYNKMTAAELERAAPGFAWRAYFAALGAPTLAELNVRQPAYIKRVAELAAARPAAEWRTYLRWHLLRAAADKLDSRHEALHFDFFERTLLGKQDPAPRAKRVMVIIGGRYGQAPMAEALGQVFVAETFPPEAKARMLEMVGHVKDALRDRLRTVEWMTEETRARSLEKLAAMKVKMGYPDKWKDFSSADVGARPFAENWLNANRFAHRRGVARIGQPVDRDEWRTSPHIVNAFYSAANNEIVFPAAILQPPFFDLAADDAVNYGGIGMVIGHEITHGFDDRGRKFDAAGNLRDWWTAADAKRYDEHAQRVVRQYSGFDGPDGLKVNGRLTLGENLSDLGGTKVAYLALKKALQAHPTGKVDGFTPEQRFFMSYAQIWRRNTRPEHERLLVLTDSHSPSRYRVKGALAHLP